MAIFFHLQINLDFIGRSYITRNYFIFVTQEKRNSRRISVFSILQREEYFIERSEQTDIPEMETIWNLSINGIFNSRCVEIKVIISNKLNNRLFSEMKIN